MLSRFARKYRHQQRLQLGLEAQASKSRLQPKQLLQTFSLLAPLSLSVRVALVNVKAK